MVRVPELVAAFLRGKRIAVAGVSRDDRHTGNAVFRKLRNSGSVEPGRDVALRIRRGFSIVDARQRVPTFELFHSFPLPRGTFAERQRNHFLITSPPEKVAGGLSSTDA